MSIKVRIHPKNNWLHKAGYTLQQEINIYDTQLKDVMDNTRWYLDHLESLYTYRLSWVDYNKEHCSVRYKHRQETPRRSKKRRQVSE